MVDADDDGSDPDGADTPSGDGSAGEAPDVARTAEELAEVLSELRADLREQRRGPFGLPAPPRPGEVLRFTDEHAIPFAIAVLEANIRALELLQGAIRLVESGERAGEEARATRDRAASLSRATLDRLDDALADLEAAATSQELPPNDEARSIVAEARRLRAELSSALEDRVEGSSDEHGDAAGGADGETVHGVDPLADDRTTGDDANTDDQQGDDAAADDAVPVDVEGELQSIKEDLGKVDDGGTGDGTSSGNGDSAGDEETTGTGDDEATSDGDEPPGDGGESG